MRFIPIGALLLLVLGGPDSLASTIRVASDADLVAASALAADSSDSSPLRIELAPRTFVLHDTFRILRSNVRLSGEQGTKLVLADGVEKPVIAVGVQDEIPAERQRIHRIRIANLEIDGNKDTQRSETGGERPWIRNNGIDVRMTSHLVVENVASNRNRSGGLVVSWKSRDITVRDSVFDGNFFDGVAYYDSRDVRTIDCVMRGNDSAGISLDNDFADSAFVRCRIEGSGDVGIFVRFSERLRFERCVIAGSRDWGAFLAHDDAGFGVHDIRFTKCVFAGNNGGLYLASEREEQSSAVQIRWCEFLRNQPRPDVDSAGSPIRFAPAR